VFPLELYLDGVPTTKRDGLLAFHIVNIVSGRRHVCAVLRKSRLCQCGCRAWCTLSVIWNLLQWSLAQLSRGLAPQARHDGSAWLPSDDSRAADGSDRTVGCLLHLKGDWQEIALSLGFPTWKDSHNPCWACVCDHTTWATCKCASALSVPWVEKRRTCTRRLALIARSKC
jgi:hypothetical protein